MNDSFIKNLKVVELSSVLAGPAVGMFFAELGAEVIKIENKPAGGDMTRKWKLPSEDPQASVSAYFASVNYGKQYRMIDFGIKEELDEVKKLLNTADLVIVNFKKGDEEKFGLTYKQLIAANPTLIYAHITGYGPTISKTAFDVVLQAETGFMSMNGNEESGPVKMPVALIDVLAAHQLKEAILLALLKRTQTGKGAYVHTSLYGSAIASLVNQASNFLMTGTVAKPMGTLHPNIAPYGEILLTSDDTRVVLAGGNDKQFEDLCKALEITELLNDSRFISNSARVKNRAELSDLLNLSAAEMDAETLETRLMDFQVPHGFIRTIEEVFSHPLAAKMILHEKIEGVDTKRVSTIAFDKNFLYD